MNIDHRCNNNTKIETTVTSRIIYNNNNKSKAESLLH